MIIYLYDDFLHDSASRANKLLSSAAHLDLYSYRLVIVTQSYSPLLRANGGHHPSQPDTRDAAKKQGYSSLPPSTLTSDSPDLGIAGAAPNFAARPSRMPRRSKFLLVSMVDVFLLYYISTSRLEFSCSFPFRAVTHTEHTEHTEHNLLCALDRSPQHRRYLDVCLYSLHT